MVVVAMVAVVEVAVVMVVSDHRIGYWHRSTIVCGIMILSNPEYFSP